MHPYHGYTCVIHVGFAQCTVQNANFVFLIDSRLQIFVQFISRQGVGFATDISPRVKPNPRHYHGCTIDTQPDGDNLWRGLDNELLALIG